MAVTSSPCFRIFLVLLILGSGAVQALAWDSTGHMLVGEIAYEQVRPDVRARVDALVRTLDNRYNNHKPYNFVTAGCYMDDMRAEKGYPYSAWHYMDVNYTPDGRGYAEPAVPNVLWALQQAFATFEDSGSSGPQKSLAMAMLIHFTGDIHQPLHCVDWNDKGGNGYFIAGVPFSDLSKTKPANLHAFWDRAYRFGVQGGKVIELYYSPWPSERPGVPAAGVIKNQAAKIMERYPPGSMAELANVGDPHVWARESYRYACKFGYPHGPHPGDFEAVTLTPLFVGNAHDVACRRIALAGYRLANLLNSLFEADGATPQ